MAIANEPPVPVSGGLSPSSLAFIHSIQRDQVLCRLVPRDKPIWEGRLATMQNAAGVNDDAVGFSAWLPGCVAWGIRLRHSGPLTADRKQRGRNVKTLSDAYGVTNEYGSKSIGKWPTIWRIAHRSFVPPAWVRGGNWSLVCISVCWTSGATRRLEDFARDDPHHHRNQLSALT